MLRFFVLYGFIAPIVAITLSAQTAHAESTTSPLVPGYERFLTGETKQPELGGRILMSELGCISCHSAQVEGLTSFTKQAPILTEVGDRVQPEFLREFLKNPHQTKPGTTMPNMFDGQKEQETEQDIEALVHFLASTGSGPEVSFPSPTMAKGGKQLFEQVGCMACHNTPEPNATQIPTSVPFGTLGKKYTIPSLRKYLQDPLHVRPSGRMPSLQLDEKEAYQIATYLLRDIKGTPNVNFAYYEGKWSKVPDFDSMTPIDSGGTAEINVHHAHRKDRFGLRFQSNFHITKDGEYRFELSSDDGSILKVNGEVVIDYDGVHAAGTRKKSIPLTEGWHTFQVDYFESGGFESLKVEIAGPELSLRPLSTISSVDPKVKEAPPQFVVDSKLANQGRAVFQQRGCANCHELKQNEKLVVSKLISKPFESLAVQNGCLSKTSSKANPNFDLSDQQLSDLKHVVQEIGNQPIKAETGEKLVTQTLTTFNCYACHVRGELGGPEAERDKWFVSSIPEMGDEGRRPPALTGVGDKLQTTWLKHVLESGTDERPYMMTRMPRFGLKNVGHLIEPFEKLDRKTEAETAETDLADYRLQGEGRHFVGEKGMACIKCHTFGTHKATGIQSVNLTSMTNRIRQDWFQRYLINPQKYRKGTRMPSFFFGGQSIIQDRLEGSVALQTEAMWKYLSLRDKAGIPLGVGKSLLELTVDKEPVMYRNFIKGVSPRAISVGYPENVNITFDADLLSLALIWHGRFIDASKHWKGRGNAFQPPLGDHVVPLVRGTPFAELKTPQSAWPAGRPQESGFRFRGYQFDQKRQPIFLYSTDAYQVSDHLIPVAGTSDSGLERNLTITFSKPVKRLWYRAASAEKISDLGGNKYQLGNGLVLKLDLPSTSFPTVRKGGEQQELLIPLVVEGDISRLKINYIW